MGAAKIYKADECPSLVLFGKPTQKMGRIFQKVDQKWRLVLVGADCLAYSELLQKFSVRFPEAHLSCPCSVIPASYSALEQVGKGDFSGSHSIKGKQDKYIEILPYRRDVILVMELAKFLLDTDTCLGRVITQGLEIPPSELRERVALTSRVAKKLLQSTVVISATEVKFILNGLELTGGGIGSHERGNKELGEDVEGSHEMLLRHLKMVDSIFKFRHGISRSSSSGDKSVIFVF